MSGVKGRSGGPRPNSGRPRKEVKDWQARNLLVLRGVFSEQDIEDIAKSLRNDLKAGDKDARKSGMAYIFGAAPKEVTLLGDSDSPVEVKHGVDDGAARFLNELLAASIRGNAPSNGGVKST